MVCIKCTTDQRAHILMWTIGGFSILVFIAGLTYFIHLVNCSILFFLWTCDETTPYNILSHNCVFFFLWLFDFNRKDKKDKRKQRGHLKMRLLLTLHNNKNNIVKTNVLFVFNYPFQIIFWEFQKKLSICQFASCDLQKKLLWTECFRWYNSNTIY